MLPKTQGTLFYALSIVFICYAVSSKEVPMYLHLKKTNKRCNEKTQNLFIEMPVKTHDLNPQSNKKIL